MKMRQLTGVLLASVAMFALASSAQAQDLTRDFTGVKSGSILYAATANGPLMSMDVPPNASGQINGFVDFFQTGTGGNVEAIVNLNSNLVTFESGTATVGVNSLSRSTSGIDIVFENTNDGLIELDPFNSTIIPAGMGFYVQDRTGFSPTNGNPFTGYGQSQSVEFGDFFSTVGSGVTFAEAEFDFDVVTNGGDLVLYSLNGVVSLSFDEVGNVIINENLTGATGVGQYLNGFATGINNHHALVYDWQETNILIPLSGDLSGFESQTVSYRANVTSWTKAGCINNGLNCIVAFAGFGDPVGRGGGVEEFSAFSGDVSPFDFPTDNDHGFVIGGLNFNPVTVNVAAVPEPATWALMISGFGLAGAALRRRRRVAYI